MENRVAVTVEAIFRQLVELRQQKRPRRFFRSRQNPIVEPVEELAVARQKSPIEQREVKLNIVFFDALALFERAPSGADAESHVPKRAREIRNQGTKSLLGLFGAEQEQNVEIRVRKKQPPSIPAQRHQTQPRGGEAVRLLRIFEHLLRFLIGQRAQRQHRLACAHTRLELFADTLAFVVGLRAEDRLRGNGTLHFINGLTERQSEAGTGGSRHLRARSLPALRCESLWPHQPSIEIFYRRQSFLSWRSSRSCPQRYSPACRATPSPA